MVPHCASWGVRGAQTDRQTDRVRKTAQWLRDNIALAETLVPSTHVRELTLPLTPDLEILHLRLPETCAHMHRHTRRDKHAPTYNNNSFKKKKERTGHATEEQ